MVMTGFISKFLQRHRKWTFETTRRISGAQTVFIHIPKSAGTAFGHSLVNALHASSMLAGFDHSLFGAFYQFETIAPEVRASIYGLTDPIPKTAEVVVGHFAVSTVRRSYRGANYCTVLREPIARLLSHWLYWRQQSDEELALWGDPWKNRVFRARLPLVEFLRDPEIACQTDNLEVRMLLWPDPRIPTDDFIGEGQDSALLTDTIATLRRFEFIDFTENPDLALNVGKWIGTPFVFKRMNETSRARAEFPVNLQKELTAEVFALLENRTRLSLRLWSEIVKRRRPNEDSGLIRERILRSTIERQKLVQLER